ncbi:MAG: hypothetical protein AAFN00_17010 [Cyanobacteria bacterium J06558_2]
MAEKKQKKEPVKRQKCPYGFDCSSIMMQPGTIAHDCENLTTCKQLSGTTGIPWNATDQTDFEMVMYFADEQQTVEEWLVMQERRRQQQQIWDEESRRIRRVIRMRQHEAATLMLRSRGNHQNYETFQLEEQKEAIAAALNSFTEKLTALAANDNFYIAPENIEAHVYNVKRPSRNTFPKHWTLRQIRREQRVYYYHKLTSKEAQFVAVGQDEDGNPKACKVIHLSHSDNARNIQGRLGIERRNKLNRIKTQLRYAQQALEEAAAIADEEYSFEDILMQSQQAANELDDVEQQAEQGVAEE